MTDLQTHRPPAVTQDGLFVGGRWTGAAHGGVYPTVNPADGTVIAEVADGSAADIDAAVRAARRAFDEGPWPRMSGHERSRILLAVADLIERDAEELARLDTADMGKPISFTRVENGLVAAAVYRYYAGLASQSHGSTHDCMGPGFAYVLREPIGVIGAITPFNVPLLLSATKIAPALAAGNTLVHKPSETTPLSALKIARLFAEAGLPEGVLNVVTGTGAGPGIALVAHPGVDKIAFTGSNLVGQDIIRASADTLKKVSVELGGKSANIVFADAYLDEAIEHAFNGIFIGSGQICIAGSRLLVQRPVYDQVVDALVERAEATMPGDPMDPATLIGPLAHQAQFEKVSGYVRTGLREGAELVSGGQSHHPQGPDSGWYFQPTIFKGRNDMQIAQEEIFGPVLTVIPFDTDDEAVALANGTKFGLASGVHTSDIKRAHAVAAAMRAGTCWINTYHQWDPGISFGGRKASGYGRELGPEVMSSYTELKSVWVDLPARSGGGIG
ncbi:aldehyde dehydrogenase family protein [Streptacidiphilus cavernicola]|uniref:Aldehyde dehydrogenase n=1 Tax=Streptacidiphilus cavernicola TaxID=3342716 RepID=A0ABV6VQS5_9ACTN